MNWHRLKDELPPEGKEFLICDYTFFNPTVGVRKRDEIVCKSYCGAYSLNVDIITEDAWWAEIVPPEGGNR